MAKANFYLNDGTRQSEIELPGELFEQEINEAAIHAAVTVYLGNNRQGTSKTKTKSEVSGTKAKPWKQKGSGRARAGDNRSPIWVRGGKAHGPKPRRYTRKLNKKLKRTALLSALSLRAKNEGVHIFEKIEISEPKTKILWTVLNKAELSGKKNLFLIQEKNPNLLLAARNIPNLEILPAKDVATYHVMRYDNLVLSKEALSVLSSGEQA